jgi:hypothetical protein
MSKNHTQAEEQSANQSAILTAPQEFVTLWRGKCQGHAADSQIQMTLIFALAELCALMQERNAIAREDLQWRRQKQEESEDPGRIAARMLAAQVRIPEVVALWNEHHPLVHERIDVVQNGKIVPQGIKMQS